MPHKKGKIILNESMEIQIKRHKTVTTTHQSKVKSLQSPILSLGQGEPHYVAIFPLCGCQHIIRVWHLMEAQARKQHQTDHSQLFGESQDITEWKKTPIKQKAGKLLEPRVLGTERHFVLILLTTDCTS